MTSIGAQKAQHPAGPGSVVRVRGATWRVIDVTPGSRCRALRLRALAASPPGAATDTVLLEPFDRCVVLPPCRRQRRVSRRAWIAALGALAGSVRLADVPVAAAGARIRLWPHQLEPAMALLRGDVSRVLLADPVGLGKTIQAGVILSEFVRRGLAGHVLIVVPAGLRDQWRQELADRFGLEVTWCDAAWLAEQAARLPGGVNPWATPALRLVSMDFVKRLETLNGIDDRAWDLLVVDEAHAASAGSDRGLAVDALARRSRRVVMATATPHGGDGSAFDALCSTGRLGSGDQVAMFRRPRGLVRPTATRRVSLLRVRRSADERRMDGLLAGYARAALAGAAPPAVQLAVSVLLKRSWSSARALELTALRRRELLAVAPGEAEPLRLPFDPGPERAATPCDEVPDEVLAAPALQHTRREIAWLGAIAEAARRAARCESKLLALGRLILRVREPVIVFTEYRDTLAVVVRALGGTGTAVLHGGQAAEERRQALSAFTSGRTPVLVATDAASQGLNLHTRCRRVVLLELPWTPARVEQRIGRVDRLGQERAVRATCLVAATTREAAILGRHAARLAEVRRRLGADEEQDGSAAAVDRLVRASWCRQEGPPSASAASNASAGLVRVPPGPAAAAVDAARWLEGLRRCLGPRRASRARASRKRRPQVDGDGALVTTLRLRQRLAGASRGVLLVTRVDIGEVDRPAADVHVVPVVCGMASVPRHPCRAVAVVEDVLRHAWPLVEAQVAVSLAGRVEEVLTTVRRTQAEDRQRWAAVRAEQSRSAAVRLAQPGLFDRTPPRSPAAAPSHGAAPDEPVPAIRFRARVVLAAVFHVR